MTCKTCKDCLARYPACHDLLPAVCRVAQRARQETAYNRKMMASGSVYHRDHEDRHREKGRKRYMGANGGADK